MYRKHAELCSRARSILAERHEKEFKEILSDLWETENELTSSELEEMLPHTDAENELEARQGPAEKDIIYDDEFDYPYLNEPDDEPFSVLDTHYAC